MKEFKTPDALLGENTTNSGRIPRAVVHEKAPDCSGAFVVKTDDAIIA